MCTALGPDALAGFLQPKCENISLGLTCFFFNPGRGGSYMRTADLLCGFAGEGTWQQQPDFTHVFVY